MRSSHADGAGFPASVGVIQRGREHENSATVRDVRRTLYSSQRTPRTRRSSDLLGFLSVLCVHGGVSAFEQAARNWKRPYVRDASARGLPDPSASVLLRSEGPDGWNVSDGLVRDAVRSLHRPD